ncbi:hypothetical protein ASD78_03885 [Lysobacter sp. Root667]|uniref:TonB family protein n=1 Tax=Lysobacter sp. Root667 TaxID=1736581 RepID=UPI0006F73827|nr:TonB family protein [Lysobacter sp. Root667]KRA76781.1 hypothetical protein ASD78_03885 [Lysobacter sp. Root667]
MDKLELLTALIETALAGSGAIVLVLLLRHPLRRGFGAGAAYALWALVPAAMFAVLLPAASAPMPSLVPVMAVVASPSTAAASGSAPLSLPTLALMLWLAGTLATALVFAVQQRRFVRALGRLRLRADGLHQADAVAGLPAAIGVLRPAIVLPQDFEQRYSEQQQALLRAHEREHIARGDLLLNAAVALLRCLHWFNPLLHYAAHRFRHDQELSCDQRVIRRHPQARRAYGEAMLKTSLASRPAPLGCQWGHGHPLKERIEMLKRPDVSSRRWKAGAVLIALLAAATGTAAWSAQPRRAPAAPTDFVRADFAIALDGGQPENFSLIQRLGEPFEARGSSWRIEGKVLPTRAGQLSLEASLQRDGKTLGEPRLLMRNGEPARITLGSVRGSGPTETLQGIDVTVTLTASVKPPPPIPASASSAATASTPVAAVAADRAVAQYGALSPPPYPKGRKVSGRVLLQIKVGADGSAQEVKLARSSGDAELDSSTVTAASTWRF